MPSHYESTGAGHSGLGKQELKQRMKQHTSLRDKALRKGERADDMYKSLGKLIGTHGHGKTEGFNTDQAYKDMDKAFVTRRSAYKQAVAFNKGLKKLGLGK
jgi:hypothetical protein